MDSVALNHSEGLGQGLDLEAEILAALARERVGRLVAKSKLAPDTGLRSLERIWLTCLDYFVSELPDTTRQSIRHSGLLPRLLPTVIPQRDKSGVLPSEVLLLFLEASKDSSAPVRGHLCTARPESIPRLHYKVLSYDWGDPAETKAIWINGAATKVTRNLESALRHLRHEDEGRYVWVDPMCIDQRHSREQGCSFDALRYVYARAQEVVIWLGDETAILERAFRFLAAFNKENIAEQCYLVQHELRVPDLLPESSLGLGAVLKLMEGGWWHRGGLVQQLTRGCRASVHCGNSIADWQTFARLFEILQEKEPLVRNRNQGYLGKVLQAVYILPPQFAVDFLPEMGPKSRPINPEAFLRFIRGLFKGPKLAVNWILAVSLVSWHCGAILTGIAEEVCKGEIGRIRTALFHHAYPDNSAETTKWKPSDGVDPAMRALKLWLCVFDELQTLCVSAVTTRPFRILWLKPITRTGDGTPSSKPQIHCELISVDMDLLSTIGIRKCPFIYISRRWPELPLRGSIVLQGTEKAISSSLHADLRALCHESGDTLLWVKPLCADEGETLQSNPEKSAEAQLGHIWTEDDNQEVTSSTYDAPLCTSCKAIPWSQILEEGDEGKLGEAHSFSPRLEVVRASAASGCHLCSLVWHSLRNNPTPTPPSSGEGFAITPLSEECPCIRTHHCCPVHLIQENAEFLKVFSHCPATNRGAAGHVASLPLSASAFEGECFPAPHESYLTAPWQRICTAAASYESQ